MTTLVTGGAGMLGAELVRQILEYEPGKLAVMDIAPEALRLAPYADKIEYIQGNVGSTDSLHRIISELKPERIFHLGAMLSMPCEEDRVAATETNILGFVHLLEAARMNDVRHVIFTSSIATFSEDLTEGRLTDTTLQRPSTVYGITKLFAENMGRLYRDKHGLDFRSVRFPAVTGTGLRPGGIVNYTSAMIEDSIHGNPTSVMVAPETRIPLIYVHDAVRALRELAAAPSDQIKTVNYLVNGPTPAPSVAEMEQLVKARIPSATIENTPDEAWAPLFEKLSLPMEDTAARKEWGWEPKFDYAKTIDDFISILS